MITVGLSLPIGGAFADQLQNVIAAGTEYKTINNDKCGQGDGDGGSHHRRRGIPRAHQALDNPGLAADFRNKPPGQYSDEEPLPAADGKLPAVGNTVDISKATYTNSIGDPLLTAHWIDPDFDPDQRAFYYVRVIEIPKPRWTAYDAKFFGIDLPDEIPMTVQDRAYTSPIWYTP